MTKEHPALALLTTLIEDAKVSQTEVDLTEETNIKEWTNMPPISDELYQELLREFDNDSYYFFN